MSTESIIPKLRAGQLAFFSYSFYTQNMTELLYQTDSYLQTFSAKVTGNDPENHAVILDRTAFYPGGGGQPYDNGWLTIEGQAFPLIRPKKAGEAVLHILAADAPLPIPGIPVTGQVEWERRYKLMRTHTAMHILCGVIFRDYGASVTGGDMDPLQGRMDFEFETMHKDLVTRIEEAINLEVSRNLPVRVAILPREEAFQIPDLIRTKINLLPEGISRVRVVEIVGLDLQADGGTHVMNTSEVGRIRVVDYKSKGKINKRIYVEIES
jgi:misacylated tRNA(Ala) deacylase